MSIPDNGLTPLGMAIKHRHLSIAEYLIDKGANVNSINKVNISASNSSFRQSNPYYLMQAMTTTSKVRDYSSIKAVK